MKNTLTLLFSMFSIVAFAQSPQGINSQGVARDTPSGQPKQNTNIDVKFTILQDSVNGTPVYSESHSTQTNHFGLYSLPIGQGITTDTFSNIDWATGKKFIEVDINNQLAGTSQLLSVPYALFANKAGSVPYWEQVGLDKIYTTRKTGIGAIPGNSTQFQIRGAGVGMPFVQGNILSLYSSNSAGALVFGKLDTAGASFIQSSKTNAGSTLSLNPEGGNVGIGINPSVSLEVGGRIRSTSSYPGISFLNSTGKEYYWEMAPNGHYYLYDPSIQSYRLFFSENGKSGIKTLNPQADFDINGSARAKSMDILSNSGNTLFSIGGQYGQLNNYGSLEMYGQDGLVHATLQMSVTTGKSIFDCETVTAPVKNFRMQYPNKSDKEIWYACIEGPEAAAYERGTIQLQNGQATVILSPHFQEVMNSTTMTVQAIPLSAESKGLAIIEKSENGFMIKELWNGTGSYKVDWEVKAVRKGYENYQAVRNKDENLPILPSTPAKN